MNMQHFDFERKWTFNKLICVILQAQSQSALSQQDVSVSSLKACWDALYPEKGNSGYITLVTSSFPSTKVLKKLELVTW